MNLNMSPEKSTRTKTLTLSLRLDPKTRFMLEFMAKLKRQSITTVVEEAIQQAGNRTRTDSFGDDGKSWKSFWHVSEGLRAIHMLADGDLPSSFGDDEAREFIRWHIEFFSDTNRLEDPSEMNVEVLWPNIETYLQIWRESRKSDPWGAGYKMVQHLEAANLRPPNWPRQEKTPPKPIKNSFARDLDEEVPF